MKDPASPPLCVCARALDPTAGSSRGGWQRGVMARVGRHRADPHSPMHTHTHTHTHTYTHFVALQGSHEYYMKIQPRTTRCPVGMLSIQKNQGEWIDGACEDATISRKQHLGLSDWQPMCLTAWSRIPCPPPGLGGLSALSSTTWSEVTNSLSHSYTLQHTGAPTPDYYFTFQAGSGAPFTFPLTVKLTSIFGETSESRGARLLGFFCFASVVMRVCPPPSFRGRPVPPLSPPRCRHTRTPH